MKKIVRFFMLSFVLCLMLGVCALAASGEPSGEPAVESSAEPVVDAAAEPAEEASDEPMEDASGEPAAEEYVSFSFDVNIMVNGVEVKTAAVEVEAEGGVYRFRIAELLDTLGISLSYDEESGIATITAQEEPVETASGEPSREPAAEEPSAEPALDEPSAEPEEEASGEPSADPAEQVRPATENEFNAYVTYCVEYMTAYQGVGDGTFDEGARTMALGELSTVSFGDDVYAFPFEMYVTQFGAMDYAAFAAQSAPSGEPAGDTSEKAYQDYLCAFVMSCEDILASGAEEEFMSLIRVGDYVSFPVEMLFNPQWFGEAAMTYEEFVAAGGAYEIAEHPSNGAMPDGTAA